MTNIEEKTPEIIEPEFSNFLRDMGISPIERKNLDINNLQILDELFYEEHENTVWFHSGKLYKVFLEYNPENSGHIKIHETNPKVPLQENNQSSYWRYKYSFIFLLVGFFIIKSAGIHNFNDTFFITQSTQNNAYTVLLGMSVGGFLFADQIRNLIYKIRFYFRK